MRKDPKDKPKPVKTTMALEWKPPRRAAEVIPQRNLIPEDAATSFALSIAIPPDDRSAGYERGTAVSKEWVQATTDGAIETASYVAANLAELTGVRNDAADRKTLLQEYCVKFAERAFRRPLTRRAEEALRRSPVRGGQGRGHGRQARGAARAAIAAFPLP